MLILNSCNRLALVLNSSKYKVSQNAESSISINLLIFQKQNYQNYKMSMCGWSAFQLMI